MNFCQNCGNELVPGAKFCGACGAPEGRYMGSAPGVAPGIPGVAQRTNPYAIASLVLSILWLCGIGSVVGIIFGVVALGQVKRSEGAQKGEGLAIAGIVTGGVLFVSLSIAIAIPVFLGARLRAQDRMAESSLRNTVTAAKAIYTDRNDYRDATTIELQRSEPALTFLPGTVTSTGPTSVSVQAEGPSVFVAATRSASGVCWWIRDVIGAVPATGTSWNRIRGPTNCSAAFAPSTGWTISPVLGVSAASR